MKIFKYTSDTDEKTKKEHFAHVEDIYKDYEFELIAYHLDAYKTASYLKKKARLLTDRFI